MGKKRTREVDGKDVPPANDPDKMDEDSGDDEVREQTKSSFDLNIVPLTEVRISTW